LNNIALGEGIMKNRSASFLAVFLLVSLPGDGAAQQSKAAQQPKIRVDWQKVKEKGTVRVLVQLDVPVWVRGQLSKEAELAQGQAITAAQDALLTELAGTKHRPTAKFSSGGGMGLEVGADALAVMERSSLVVRVDEDRPIFIK